MAKTVPMRVKVEKIFPSEQITDNFSKAEMIGIIEGEYPEEYLFEFPNDKAKLLDDVIEGTYVNVSYNLRSNRVKSDEDGKKDRFYLSLSAWKVEV